MDKNNLTKNTDRRGFLSGAAMTGASIASVAALAPTRVKATVSNTNAHNVDYDPPGVGAQQRQLDDILNEVVSVTNYWDGISSIDQAIVDAVEAAGDGGTVYFPAGNYHYDSQIYITRNITLLGNRDAVIEVLSGSQGSIYFEQGFKVEGLTFKNYTGHLLKFQPDASCIEASIEIIDCHFLNGTGYCFRPYINQTCDIKQISIRNNTVEECAEGGFRVSTTVRNVVISQNHFINTPNTTGGGRAVQVGTNGTEETTTNVVISNNTFDGLIAGDGELDECQAILVYATRVTVSGNTLQGMVQNQGDEHEMIYLKALEAVVDGNVVDAAGCTGDAAINIKNFSLSKRAVVTNNVVYDSSTLSATNAIKVTGSVVVSGNNIENTLGGISVINDDENPAHETVIANNIVKISDAGGKALGLLAVDNAVVTGNIFDSPCKYADCIRIQKNGSAGNVGAKQLIFSNNIVRHKSIGSNCPLTLTDTPENIKISGNDFWVGSYIKLSGSKGNISITDNRIFDHPDLGSSRVKSFFSLKALSGVGATLRFSGNHMESSGDIYNGNLFERFDRFLISNNEISSTSNGSPYEISSSFYIEPDTNGSDCCLIHGNIIHSSSAMKNRVFVNGGSFSVFELRNNFFNGSGEIIKWAGSTNATRWKATDNSVVNGAPILDPSTFSPPKIVHSND